MFRLCCRYAGQTPGASVFVPEIQQALGGNVGWNRILNYLRFLDGTLLVRLIPPLELRLKRRKSPSKVSLCDHALRASWLQEVVPFDPDGLAANPHLADLAGRLAEDAGRPALVVSTLVEPWRGSARSAGGVDLASAMEGCGHLLERFGGHAAAAGCSVAEEAWPAFRERFRALVAAAGPIDPRPPLRVDLALSAAEIDYRLLRELSLLAPTGPGNPDPLLAVLSVEVVRVRAANGGHTQLTLRKGLEVLDGIAFGRPDLAGAVAPGDRLDVVGRLASRSFGGFESLQLEIRDAATSGLQRPMPAAAATPAVASEMRP